MGTFEDWLGAVHLLDYGNTPEEISVILAARDFCGLRYTLREIPWPLKNQKPPAPGPYYGVYLLGEDGMPTDRLCLLLISNRGLMEYGAIWRKRPWERKAGLPWFALIGNPKLLGTVEAREEKGWEADKQFASIYWKTVKDLETYLEEKHSKKEMESCISQIFQPWPRAAWSYRRADQPFMRFRDGANENSFIRCDFENKIVWDDIWAIRLENDNRFAREGGRTLDFSSPYPFHEEDDKYWCCMTLLANLYFSEDEIVGVLFLKNNYEPENPSAWINMVEPIGCEICWFYPEETLHYWRTFPRPGSR